MKIRHLCLALAIGVALASPISSYASDDVKQMNIADAMNSADKDKLDDSVKFYWGNQSHPGVSKKYGEFTSNKKTSFFGKSAEAGCERAFLSAMIALHDRATREGGNAVINLHSVYKGHDFVSDTQYECGAGHIMGGVAIRGEVVRIGR
ncbi:MAG: excinuclease ATPase subunit [Stenotrophobium sp.]